MKKNRMLKIASAMIMLCLITTCAIGTTFAKYITAGSVNDAARVAHWGVEITMDGDPMFDSQYETHDGGYSGALSVKSTTNVVAPGTSSEDVSGGLIFKISGTPEVASRITIELTEVKDVWLKAGNDYYDGTQATIMNGATPEYAKFDLAQDYYPIKWTLRQVAPAGYEATLVNGGTLADVAAFLAAYSGTEYAPNTVLDSTYELSWSWAFAGDDKADTLLGNIISGNLDPVNMPDAALYCTTVSYKLSVTVEQID